MRWRRDGAFPRLGLGVAVLATALACAPAVEAPPESEDAAGLAAEGPVRDLELPVRPGAFAPDLTPVGDRLLVTWLEPLGEGEGESSGHRVRFATLTGDRWSEPATVAEGDDFFANWADFPAVVETADGALYAHWLAKTGDAVYAYSPFVARSDDGGSTWEALGPLNDDQTPTEHGFVSWLPEGDGARAFWLDGRAMAEGGDMTLRTARVDAAGVGPAEVLDRRTCECCSTDATVVPTGPLVVYRDRSPEEVRDVALVGRAGSEWQAPRSLAADAWKIPGCPVNGPEVDADGERVAVAWFTGANDDPTVQVAFSTDGAATFAPPIALDLGAPLGRVDVVLAGDDAVVVWLRQGDGKGEVMARRVAADGRLGEAVKLAETAAARASGFPRLASVGGRLVAAWVEVSAGAPSSLHVAELRPPPA